jgi:hypothetical protein
VSDLKQYFEYTTRNGVVLIEHNKAESGMSPVSAMGDLVHDTGEAFETALARIQDVLEPIEKAVWNRLTDADALSVEFGFKLSGTAGIIIASSQLEGNFKVSVSWHKTK